VKGEESTLLEGMVDGVVGGEAIEREESFFLFIVFTRALKKMHVTPYMYCMKHAIIFFSKEYYETKYTGGVGKVLNKFKIVNDH